MSRRAPLLALAAAGLLAAPALRAQAAPAEGTAFRQVLSVQPLAIPALGFMGEFEKKATPNVTVGVGASYFSPSDLTWESAEAKVRYYPTAALKGFAIGGTLGVLHVDEDFSDAADCVPSSGACTKESASGPTVGVQLDYLWLLGRQKKFAVALGAGAKRFIGRGGGDVEDFSAFYPTARASVGWAF